MSSVDEAKIEDLVRAPNVKLEKPKKTQSQGVQLLPLLIKAIKTGGILLAVWLVGYWGLSLTWVMAATAIYVGREEYSKAKAKKKEIQRDSGVDEKEVILARVDELPSWVYFPDVERAEWLNKMMQQMWPYIGEYIKAVLQTTVLDVIKTSLPEQLTPFKFEKIDVGSIPPRIGGVKVYIENIKRDEIIMDVELTMASDADVTVSVRGIRAGIKDIMLHGTMRIVMTPLVNKIPIIGGLSVFFLNQPEIDFDFTDVANILDAPLLSNSLRTIVSDQIANYLVLPNKVPITIIEDVATQLQYPLPQGVIRLHVFEASQLKRADIGIGSKGKSDPYCVITAGGMTYKTKIIDDTEAPEWNETFEFVIDKYEKQVINFEVFDKDPGDDDQLGDAQIDVEELVKQGVMDKWLTLQNVKTGRLHVKARWLYLSTNPEDYNPSKAPSYDAGDQFFKSSAILLATVDSAKDLPSSHKTMVEPSPYVSLEVGNKKEKTSIKSRSTNPIWSETFQLLVADINQQDLIIQILDSSKEDARIGYRKIAIQTLTGLTDMTSNRPYALKESTANATITLRLCLRILTPNRPPEFDITSKIAAANPEKVSTNNSSNNAGPSSTIAPTATSKISPSTGVVDSGDGTKTFPPAPPTQQNSGVKSSREAPNHAQETKLITPKAESEFHDKTNLPGDMFDPPIAETAPAANTVRYRGPPVTPSNDGRFGRIQLTMRYSSQKERFIVVIHQCVNLTPCDDDELADPYIKMYLLPDKNNKKKTQTQKNTLSPVFDETFDWTVARADLANRTLSVSVKNSTSMFSREKKFLGFLRLQLASFDDLTKAYTAWFDLSDPEAESDEDKD